MIKISTEWRRRRRPKTKESLMERNLANQIAAGKIDSVIEELARIVSELYELTD